MIIIRRRHLVDEHKTRCRPGRRARHKMLNELRLLPRTDSTLSLLMPTLITHRYLGQPHKVLTDTEGKFSILYPRKEVLTVFAKAQRIVGEKTESYY